MNGDLNELKYKWIRKTVLHTRHTLATHFNLQITTYYSTLTLRSRLIQAASP